MKRNKILVCLFSLLLLVVFPHSALAEEFNISVNPTFYSILTFPNTPNKLTLTAISPNLANTTYKIYPFGLDWKKTKDAFHYEFSNWFKFKPTELSIHEAIDYPVSMTMTATEDTEVGEYYKVVGFTNHPFNCEASDNPARMVGVPMTVAVAKGMVVNTSPKTPENGLSSYLSVANFTSGYIPFNQTEKFYLDLKNEGNISTTPTGYISIKDQKGKEIETLPFNQNQLAILPNEHQEFTLTYKSNQSGFGFLKARLFLGYDNQINHSDNLFAKELKFLYFSPIAVQLNMLATLLVPFFLIFKAKLALLPNILFRFISFSVFAIPIAMLIYMFYIPGASNILGTEALPPQTDTLTMTAEVKDMTGFQINPANPRLLTITSKNPKGWRLWSLTCKWPQVIAEDSGENYQRQVEIPEKDFRYPILLMSKTTF